MKNGNNISLFANNIQHLCVIFGTSLVSVMGVSVILPVLPTMAEAFALSMAEVGIIVISFTAPGIVLAPLGGILADRLGRKAVLIPSLLLFALGGCLAALAQSMGQLVMARILQGCGAASLGVLNNTLIGDVFHDENDRLRVMGYGATVLSLGAALFPALGGVLGKFAWQVPLLVSLVTVPLAYMVYLLPLTPVRKSDSFYVYAQKMRHIIFQKRCLVHFAVTLCAFSILYGPLITYFPVMAYKKFEASPLVIGCIFAFASLGTASASLGLGWLRARFSAGVLIRCGSLFFLFSMAALWWFALYGEVLWLCIIPVLCFGIGQGLAYPAVMTSLSVLAPHQGRGVLMAVNGTTLRLAQSIFPLICGLAYMVGEYPAVYALGVVIACVMLYIAFVGFRTQ